MFSQEKSQAQDPFIIVLGIAQDAGFPQAGCKKDCCSAAWHNHELRRHATALGLVDPQSGQRWLFECTPGFPDQLLELDNQLPKDNSPGLNGIFLTHAHIGHYTGLMYLGREVMGANKMPVYGMPRMRAFLTENGPWSQLVALENIVLRPLVDGQAIMLNGRLRVTPMMVPHRDEFSETVAFKIVGPKRSVLFLPDIDKWSRWQSKIEDVVQSVDVAYLDATFYDDRELPGRNMAEIPHPFVVESIERFGPLSEEQRNKVRFIHLNHTNPALDPDSTAAGAIKRAGMRVAEQNERVEL